MPVESPPSWYITIGIGLGPGLEEGPRQVVGVVADVSDAGPAGEPAMHLPMAQVGDSMNARNNRLLPLTWVVRTAAGIPPPSAAIQKALHQASAGLPLERVRTMHEVVAASSARTEFYTTLVALFAAVAMVLAAVGLYGLMAYSVEQRTREIGIRMAFGAGPDDVRWLVVWQGMRLAVFGIVAGIPVALALTRMMVSMIFGIRVWDPAALAMVAMLLGGVALIAAYLPSVRATRVDPLDALRA
jgi:putative ABC transport system permease protein